MANCVTDWVFRRQKFCCCLPVRLGVAILSFLSILLVGLLMIVIWFEVATNYMSGKEKAAFVVAGVVETFLFLASLLGFIGTCARKQSFVVIYATFLYIHFFINLGVALYFLVMITSVADSDITKLCQEGLKDSDSKSQCSGLLNISKDVFWAISIIVLAVEAYCALVVTRYVNQLRYEKRDVRRSRMLQRQSAYDAFHRRFGSEGEVPPTPSFTHPWASSPRTGPQDMATDKQGLLHSEFDPYHEHERSESVSPGISPGAKSPALAEGQVYGVSVDARTDVKGEDIEMGLSHFAEQREKAGKEMPLTSGALSNPHDRMLSANEPLSRPPSYASGGGHA